MVKKYNILYQEIIKELLNEECLSDKIYNIYVSAEIMAKLYEEYEKEDEYEKKY